MNPTFATAICAVGALVSAQFVPIAADAKGTNPRTAASPWGDAEVAAAAAHLDRLVEDALAKNGLEPNRRVDDATFVRRAYVQIAGRLPSAAETATFLKSPRASRRRADLIHNLIESPAHESRMFHYWADLLRLKSRLQNRISGEPYIHYVKQSLRDNKAYDDFVRELLTAEGPAHQRDNGATGYYLRDRGMPEDNMANTVRVFLGTRVECAQCHNHPFDSWTQMDFYKMVAFTGGMQYAHQGDSQIPRRELATLGRTLRKDEPNKYRAFRRMFQSTNAGVDGSGSGLVRLPKDYQYEDASPQSIVKAEAMFDGPVADVDIPAQRGRGRNRNRQPRRRFGRMEFPESGTRETYAEWLTSPENPRFTTVIANRMWKLAMGRGLIEPVDDIRSDTVSSNPELMDALEELMVQVGYDLRRFQEVLYNTNTWQRVANSEPDPDETYHFSGPVLRRMSAEQIWDSMLAFTMDDVDKTLQAPDAKATSIYANYDEFAGMSRQELDARLERESLRYSDPAAYRKMVRDELAKRRAQSTETKKANELREAIKKARKAKNWKKVRELVAEAKRLRDQARQRGRNRGNNALVRASELPSPAPEGHFLRRFGQSGREQIDGSFDEANVPQVLSLLNGFVEQRVLADSSALMKQLRAEPTPRAQFEAAFQATLGRKPTGRERNLWLRDITKDPEQGLRDLVWVLLNTHEFLFVQ